MAESGLTERAPYWSRVTEREIRGVLPEVTHADVLDRVMKLCHQETGRWSWPDLPEKYWDMAFQELFGTKEHTHEQ